MIGATPLGDHAPGGERAVAGLIAVYGATAAVAGIAPKDLPFARHTLASQFHVAATVVGGAAVIAAMVVVALRSPSPAARRASVVAAVLATVTTIVFRFSWGSPLYGLVERTLVMAAMAG